MSAANRRRVQQQFDRASRLLASSDCDRAEVNRLLVVCLAADANNLIYLDAFLTNLQLWQKSRRQSLSFQAIWDWHERRRWRSCVAARQWATVLELGPRILAQQPTDLTVYRALAEACAALKFQHAELRYLRAALQLQSLDPDLNRQAALAFQRHGLFEDAAECWLRIQQANPHDAEAGAALQQLGTAPLRTAVDGSNSSIESLKKQTAPQPISTSGTDADSEIRALCQAADQHLAAERLAEAESLLLQALARAGSNLQIRERLEDLALRKQRQKLVIAERLATAEAGPAERELVLQMRQELNRQELDFFYRRSERYPADAELKFQLALRLKRAGNYAEAIKCFEPLTKTAPVDARVLVEIGECHQMLRRFPRALAVYRDALEAARQAADVELTKLCLYRAATLATGLNDFAAAVAWLEELCSQDSGYKDAADRLDKIRSMRHKGGPFQP